MNLTDEQRRALQLLAHSPNGCTEVFLRGYGFKRAVLAALVDDGLATETSRDSRQGKPSVTVAWITITDAGRKAVAE